MRTLRRLALALLIGLVALAALIALLPQLLLPRIESAATAALSTPVSIGWVNLGDALRGGIGVHRVTVGDGDALTIERVTARVDLQALLDQKVVVQRVEIDGLRGTVEQDAQGRPALRGLPFPEPDAGAEAVPVTVQEIVVSAAEIVAVPPSGLRRHPVAVRLDELVLRQVPTADVGPAFEGELGGTLDGVPLTARARADQTAAGPRIEAEADLTGAPVSSEQLVLPPGFESLTATVDGKLGYQLDPARKRDRLTVDLTVSKLALAGSEQTALAAESVTVQGLVLDLAAGEANLGRITLQKPRIEAALVRRGLVYPGLLPALVDSGVEAPAAAGAAGAWKVIGGRLDATAGVLTVRRDQHRARLELTSFSWREIASGKSGELRIEARVDSGGSMEVTGQLGIDPPALAATLALTELALPDLAALADLPLQLTRGTASGTIEVSGDPAAPRIDAVIDATQLHTAPPRPEDVDRVLAVDRLRTRFTVQPGAGAAIEIASLDLEYPYLMVQRDSTGIFPLDVLSTPQRAASVPSTTGTDSAPRGAAPRPVRIGTLRVAGGRGDFVDRTTTPNYWTGLASAIVLVESLHVAPLALSMLDLSGRQDELHPVRASVQRTGDARWQGKASLEGISLPTLNAYLSPVIGYTAEAGTLSVDVAATLDGPTLVASSEVALDGVSLRQTGLDVIQRETGVPLTVALSLLKDIGGEIELTIPVRLDTATGSYDLGSFVTDAIGRAVLGALSSPLRWLGMLFGTDGPPNALAIDPVPFRAGSAALDEAGATRITQVARILATHAELDVILKAQIAVADRDAVGDAALVDLAQRRVAAVRDAFASGRDGAPILPSRLIVAPWSPAANGSLDPAPAVYVEVQAR